MKKFLVMCLGGAVLALGGCVETDANLGESLIDKSLLYDTHTVDFEIGDIQLQMADALSGYSSSRLTIGAIRDAKLGLTTREAAFTLIPQPDTLDLGANPTCVSFCIYFSADTVSYNNPANARIMQNIRATELLQTLPESGKASCTQEISHGTTPITDGTPVFSGSGAITFKFSQAYGDACIKALKDMREINNQGKEEGAEDWSPEGVIILKQRAEDEEEEDLLIDRYDDWVKTFKGVHLTVDAPEEVGGGRINLFNFPCLSVSNNYYVRNDNLAELKIHSTFKGVEKDTTYYFIPGETEFFDEVEYLSNNTSFDQYCFNRTTHSTSAASASAEILVEGGGGLKPVIMAQNLRAQAETAIRAQGDDPSKVLIVKASLVLPFEMPADYLDLNYFPGILSPTVQTVTEDEESGETYISFAGISDASVSTENQGSIDRSNLQYAPDITYHMQTIMEHVTDEDPAEEIKFWQEHDIWLLNIYTEKIANASGSLYDSEYYQQLLYASYYNSLYGGGYGYGSYGYGGYGSYGYGGYDNYYSYMMLAQMMNASSQQSYSYATELDKDRFYRAVLNGPAAPGSRKPSFRITYAATHSGS